MDLDDGQTLVTAARLFGDVVLQSATNPISVCSENLLDATQSTFPQTVRRGTDLLFSPPTPYFHFREQQHSSGWRGRL